MNVGTHTLRNCTNRSECICYGLGEMIFFTLRTVIFHNFPAPPPSLSFFCHKYSIYMLAFPSHKLDQSILLYNKIIVLCTKSMGIKMKDIE